MIFAFGSIDNLDERRDSFRHVVGPNIPMEPAASATSAGRAAALRPRFANTVCAMSCARLRVSPLTTRERGGMDKLEMSFHKVCEGGFRTVSTKLGQQLAILAHYAEFQMPLMAKTGQGIFRG